MADPPSDPPDNPQSAPRSRPTFEPARSDRRLLDINWKSSLPGRPAIAPSPLSDRRILGEHDGAPRKPPDNPPSAPRKPPDNPLGDPSAPRSNPRSAPRRDGRPTLTLKGDEVGPEFRALLNRAARLAGVTQAAYVGRAVTEAAQRDLTGRNNPESAPQGNPPAVVTARLEAQVEALAAKVEAIPALVAQVEALAAAAQRPGLWARLEQVLLAARGKPSK